MSNSNNGTDQFLNLQRTSKSVNDIKAAILGNLTLQQGRFPQIATLNDYYLALAYTVRDYLMAHWVKTASTYFQNESRTVCYLSAEFLIGPQLENNLVNLGIYEAVKQACQELNLDLTQLANQEPEPGLGNGGLGRLAACYMDSLSTNNIPAIGYGIRYEFGIFNQEIKDGWQVESTDKWLRYGNPWEIAKTDINFQVQFGGTVKVTQNHKGELAFIWQPQETVVSVPYDIPVIGYKANTANFIRLWKAEACESFDFHSFNSGDYYGAVENKVSSENLTKVLYPNDEPESGKILRLKQQYFFVSSSLQDMIRIYKQKGDFLGYFADKYVIQLNDTHPAIGIAELMHLLVDQYSLPWDQAWEITFKAFCYTNHTLLPEALETWSLSLFEKLLPRHLQIIFEINQRFLNSLPKNLEIAVIRRLSIIDETGPRKVRMANLACIGSHAINGVSKLHSELLKKSLLKDFYTLWPERFSNITNGVTPRRFVLVANPHLSQLINAKIGHNWLKNLYELKGLEKHLNDQTFLKQWSQVKYQNKQQLAQIILERTGEIVDPQSIFDVQAKRIHEYKRQHLNILYVIAMYHRLKNQINVDFTPRTVIFAGKAAPGYYHAKLIIKLINQVAKQINHDPAIKNRLKVVFLPNYNVQLAQKIYPAADLSEQISTAGLEASGTGNMKFALNGALTIGTLDGANVEMLEAVGKENFFLFGLHTKEVLELKPHYRPIEYINRNPELKASLELLKSPFFIGDPEIFKPLLENIINHDPYLVCADFESYLKTQDQIARSYLNKKTWVQKSILNVARMGKFSSDRAIQEYCEDIWKIKSVQISE